MDLFMLGHWPEVRRCDRETRERQLHPYGIIDTVLLQPLLPVVVTNVQTPPSQPTSTKKAKELGQPRSGAEFRSLITMVIII